MESVGLENIEGVGSAIAGKLRSTGITTVAALAGTLLGMGPRWPAILLHFSKH